ncbi:MAG TPA: energy transducer TonB [Bacteroidia bacterium]|jgi:protein TonB|nr:energy transducer TonB [Bacteroidia bacterium]
MKKYFLVLLLSLTAGIISAQVDTMRVMDATVTDPNADTTVYSNVEQMPAPAYQMGAYFSKNVKYPQDAKMAHQQGTSYISFVVEADGSISNVTLVKSAGTASMDREAMRVITAMPKWNPGMQSGKAVRVKMMQGVKFSLL